MTNQPSAIFAIDLGAATSAASIIGPIGDRQRLLVSVALPAGADLDTLLGQLVARLVAADPALAAELGVSAGRLPDWRRLIARSLPPPLLAVLAASERDRVDAERVASLAGWRTRGASLEADGPVGVTRLALERDVAAIVVTGREPTSREEQASMAALVATAAGIFQRGLGVRMALLGALTAAAPSFTGEDSRPDEGSPPGEGSQPGEGPHPHARSLGPLLLGPASGAGGSPGALRRFLERLAPDGESARRAAFVTAADLAATLDRRIELIEIGFDSGLRGIVGPGGVEAGPIVTPAAALVPPEPDDEIVDGILAWSTVAIDRQRLRDRLRELRFAPWIEAYGEGAQLRLAATRAALERLVRATPEFQEIAAPDLVLVAGGGFAAAPGPAAALAVIDLVRRPGVSQIAFDRARLLGPLGTIADEEERRALVASLADDLLLPLGSAIVPRGLRAGRGAGKLTVRGSAGETDLDLVPGGLQLVDLPPGQLAIAELRFREAVSLGTRGRWFAVEVGGGLGGLLVDLRDVPLHLPERAERRRALLATWQAAFWSGIDE